MATYTTNYNLAKPEGTDAYNHLIYDNPNMDTIDAALKTVDDLTVSRATCVKTGTNHAVTRINTNAVVFRFTATGDFDAGDTMTVDGVSVSVFLPNGEAANSGAYIINSEVLAAIQGTRVTLYTNALNQIAANRVTYDNTASGLTANDVQNAIDQLNDKVGEWSAPALLYSETWGDLYGSYNEKCKLAVLRWYGNSTSATAGTKIYSLSGHYKPAFFMASPMINSIAMEVNQATEEVNIQFTANNWVSGSIMYPAK